MNKRQEKKRERRNLKFIAKSIYPFSWEKGDILIVEEHRVAEILCRESFPGMPPALILYLPCGKQSLSKMSEKELKDRGLQRIP